MGVWKTDRLGRSLHDIINTIHFFNGLKIAIEFISQGLRTIDEEGKENPISKMVISILAVVAEADIDLQPISIPSASLLPNLFLLCVRAYRIIYLHDSVLIAQSYSLLLLNGSCCFFPPTCVLSNVPVYDVKESIKQQYKPLSPASVGADDALSFPHKGVRASSGTQRQ